MLRSALFPLALLCFVACESAPSDRGGAGESCTKRADCAENLGCFESVCGTSLQAVQAELAKRAAETGAAPAAADDPAPKEASPAPTGEPAEASIPEAPQLPPDEAAGREPLTVAGPFESLEKYCPTRQEEGLVMSCNYMMRPKFIDESLDEGIRVRDYYVGSKSTGGSRGISIQNAKGIYFVEDIAGEAAGAKVGSRVIRSTLSSSSKTDFDVVMYLEGWKLELPEGAVEGEAKPERVASVTQVRAECKLSETGAPKCWFGVGSVEGK